MSNFVKKDSVVKMSSGEKSKEKCNYFEGFLKNTFVAFLYIVNNSLDHPSIIGIVAFFIDTAVFYKNGILTVKIKKISDAQMEKVNVFPWFGNVTIIQTVVTQVMKLIVTGQL